MNIVQKLSLNKHPKDVPDLSLVMAQNIKVSNDESCITNEEGIRENTYIKSFLNNYYNTDYKIVGIIPCNNELVIIAIVTNDPSFASIFRYREQTSITKEDMKCFYTKLKYNGGKITGTFTYNVEDSLVLALSEYDADVKVPMKVINLGNFDNEFIANDLNINDSLLSLVPEVKIPSYNYDYTKGRAYKGWYFLFIRYKINTVDYTQWYNFGTPIYIDNYSLKNIVKESQITGSDGGQATGFSDTFSDDEDIVNSSFIINKINETNIDYKNYQLGFICSTKSYTKVYRTEDINISNLIYQLDYSNLIESSVIEFTNNFYNYYNVKNVINYKNRLYISNYLESEIDDTINEQLINASKNVSIKLNRENYVYDWVESFEYDGGNKILNNRTKNRTLLPNGVYNFFIHFVDKYGHATKGYKIDPKQKFTIDGIDKYVVPVPFTLNDTKYYLFVPCDITLWQLVKNYIYTNNLTVASGFGYPNPKYVTLNSNDIINRITNEYSAFISSDKHKDLYVSQFINGGYYWEGDIYDLDLNPKDWGYEFGITVNTNGEVLWRVPEDNYTGFPQSVLNDPIAYRYTMNVSLNNIPKPYIGYYISYEEYEPNKIVTGYFTKRNANVKGLENIPNYNIASKESNEEESGDGLFEWPDWNLPDPSNDACFYSSTYDINDNIKLNYNTLCLEGVWRAVPRLVGLKLIKASEEAYPTDGIENLNGIPIDNRKFILNNYKLAVANDPTANRTALGTCLFIEDKDGLFDDNSEEFVTVYIASLYNYNNNIYSNKVKRLIRLSDIIYDSKAHAIDNYNGIFSTEGVIVYNDNGYIANAITETNANKSVTAKNGNYPYLADGVNHLAKSTYGINYITFNVYDDIVFNSKVFNNKPKIVYNLVGEATEENTPKVAGSIVEPINSIDLFKNPQGSMEQFYPITNTNYVPDSLNVISFDKTVRRSSVIQDETRVNAWRQFPIEGYKNITENKGKITNLVGIGSLFLVHTEHSMFMFDTGNTLEAVDQSIQLAQPDAFDVAYKEVFTSDLGFGGLQDKESAIIDQFGYIFYNNDSNRLYQFDNKQLAMIDDNIVEWLLRNKPYNVRFANDKQNNRLLIKFEYGDNQYSVLSYNYNIKSFISTHSYYFDKAYNTKINLYLRCDDNHNNCSLHQFIKNKNNYCSFDNVKSNLGTVVNQDSKLSIIVNPSFEVVKYLEYFNYKLSKVADVDKVSLVNLPVEGTITPFAGNKLKVYNDLTNTGELDINVNEEISKNIFANFDKPYWHLGVWNYSYLRNKINTYPSTKNPDVLSRIIGNYFIIEFTFDNSDNKLIEFEGLNYKVIR